MGWRQSHRRPHAEVEAAASGFQWQADFERWSQAPRKPTDEGRLWMVRPSGDCAADGVVGDIRWEGLAAGMATQAGKIAG